MLGGDALGRDSDFFVYGGNSLLATQLVSRIGSETGVRVGRAGRVREPDRRGPRRGPRRDRRFTGPCNE
ncbi:hypothetical protein GS415_04140 [Rhodococcus hoagii]|nr:hypothetical protein [Prescottella equi]